MKALSSSRRNQLGFWESIIGALASAVIGAVLKDDGDSSPAPTYDDDTEPGGYNPSGPAYGVNINGSRTETNPYIAPAIGASSALLQGGLSYIGGSNANAANAQQARDQMDFQASQTGTAYQRAVKDMQAAGLNPMLAYSQGGASSGAGAQAKINNAVGEGVNAALSGATGIANIKQLLAQSENTDATTERTRSETALNALQGFRVMADTQQSTASAGQLRAMEQNILAQLKGTLADSDVKENTVASRTGLAGAEFHRMREEARRSTAEATLSGLEIPRQQNRANAESTWFKQNLSPFLGDFGQLLNSANSVGRFSNYLRP